MKQLALPFAKQRRGGPGRPPTRAGVWVKHRPRPWHDKDRPVHVKLRALPGMLSLRDPRIARAIDECIVHAATSRWAKPIIRRRTFRVVAHTIHADHLALTVEATSRDALARGMQGLASGLARRVNRVVGRRGTFFIERYDQEPQ
jgi:AcrR family transcriptional regulator